MDNYEDKSYLLFSKRYNVDGDESICEDVDYSIKQKISDVMTEFAEPQKIKPYRYDDFEETTALEIAANRFDDYMGCSLIAYNAPMRMNDPIAVLPLHNIFDVVELQYEELSEHEKSEFQNAINDMLRRFEMPWILFDGHMIKIESKQFEMDLKRVTLERMKEIKNIQPDFKSAYGELLYANECLSEKRYAEAISNAEKSYESVLKITCNLQKGTADALLKKFCNDVLAVPESMKNSGFREKVLMSLPFIRNNSGSDHGAGSLEIEISEDLASLAINLASSLNSFLIEQYLKSKTSEENGV